MPAGGNLSAPSNTSKTIAVSVLSGKPDAIYPSVHPVQSQPVLGIDGPSRPTGSSSLTCVIRAGSLKRRTQRRAGFWVTFRVPYIQPGAERYFHKNPNYLKALTVEFFQNGIN